MKSVLKDWVMNLGLRHQGVLISATRGCDVVPRMDVSKKLLQAYRGTYMHSFSDDPASYISFPPLWQVREYMEKIFHDHDHYPIHFMLHLMHASEIVGYKHPDKDIRELWHWFYCGMTKKFHLHIETEEELDERLLADEELFAKRSKS